LEKQQTFTNATKRMKYLFAIFLLMNWLPYKLDEPFLYYSLNSLFQIVVFIIIFRHEKKSVHNLFLCASMMLISIYDLIDYTSSLFMDYPSKYFNNVLFFSVSLIGYILIFKNRYKWEKLKSDQIDPTKVQAVFSKPDTVLTLFGAAYSFSPKCSVRYIHKGKMIRFTKGKDKIVLSNVCIKKSDIIKDTMIPSYMFKKRYNEIKEKRFNLFFFNCRHIFNTELIKD